MKKIIIISFSFLFFCCQSNSKKSDSKKDINLENSSFYGTIISEDSVKSLISEKETLKKLGSKSCKLSGQIIETCSMKGCWMSLDIGGDTLFVKFRDYAFFVPKDSVEGKRAIIQGDLFLDTVSVEMLKHYAEDAGKTEKEIAQITEPSYKLGFTADGVIIK